jgi:hypothetical protein
MWEVTGYYEPLFLNLSCMGDSDPIVERETPRFGSKNAMIDRGGNDEFAEGPLWRIDRQHGFHGNQCK